MASRALLAVDIVICTANRSALLDRTLDALAALQVPSAIDWHVLVVDDNSKDATSEVLARHARRLPLRSAIETGTGLAGARNRAIAESQADYLLWTDDDVVVGRSWLASYVAAFQVHPDGAFFGGPVDLDVDGSSNAPHGAAARFGASEFQFDEDRLPVGGNCAVRLAIQRRFRYGLSGLQAGRGDVSDQTAVLRQMLAAGHRGWWVPGARVQHIESPEAQPINYLQWIVGVAHSWGRLRAHS